MTSGFQSFNGMVLIPGSDSFSRDWQDSNNPSYPYRAGPQFQAACAGGFYNGKGTLRDANLSEYYPGIGIRGSDVCMAACPSGWEAEDADVPMWPNGLTPANVSRGQWRCKPTPKTVEVVADEIPPGASNPNGLNLLPEEIALLPDGTAVKEFLQKDPSALEINWGYLQDAVRALGSALQIRVAVTEDMYNRMEYPERYNLCKAYAQHTADPIYGTRTPGGDYWMMLYHTKYGQPYVRGPPRAFEEDLPNSHCPTDAELLDWRLKYGDLFVENQKAERQRENEAIFQAEQEEQRRQNALKDNPCLQYDVIDPRRALCEAGKKVDEATGLGDAWSDLKYIIVALVVISLVK